MQQFYFNEFESIRDMGVFVVDKIEFPSIDEDVEQEPIEGSPIGSLTIKTGNYKDSIIPMKLRFISKHDLKEQFKNVKRWLKRISDNRLTFDYEKCYIVKNVTLNPYTLNQISGDFEVEFICEPFLKGFYTEFEVVSNREVIYNDGDVESYPKVKIQLPSTKSNIQIFFNNEGVHFKDVSDYIFIDSERQIVLDKNNQSLTKNMIGNFPKLLEGENTISWTGNITKLEVNKNERCDC